MTERRKNREVYEIKGKENIKIMKSDTSLVSFVQYKPIYICTGISISCSSLCFMTFRFVPVPSDQKHQKEKIYIKPFIFVLLLTREHQRSMLSRYDMPCEM